MLHKYVLRFETVLQVSQTRKIAAWMDLDDQLDIPAPNVKGRIRVKVLRLPKGIEPKSVPVQPRLRSTASNQEEVIRPQHPQQK